MGGQFVARSIGRPESQDPNRSFVDMYYTSGSRIIHTLYYLEIVALLLGGAFFWGQCVILIDRTFKRVALMQGDGTIR